MQHEPQQLLDQGNILDPVLSPFGSNYTFLVQVRNGSQECRAVYKPRKGEVPLWDFPDGTLYKREYAAYLMSEILGWGFIPPTTIRDGPYGIAPCSYWWSTTENKLFQLRRVRGGCTQHYRLL